MYGQYFLVFVAFFGVSNGYAENAMDFKLLEDTFAKAYAEKEARDLRSIDSAPRKSIIKRQRVPLLNSHALPPQRRVYKPAYAPNRVMAYPRSYPQFMPRREMFTLQPNVMLPQRSRYMFNPGQNIAYFPRRNPYLTMQPTVVARTKPKSAVRANRRAYPFSPYSNYLNNQKQYYAHMQKAAAIAQRRTALYPQRPRFFYKQRAPVALQRQGFVRSRTPGIVFRTPNPVYAFRRNHQGFKGYGRQYSVTGNHLNMNTGTSSHTVSNSVLKAPGHTTTDSHVLNKQQTGGKVRGVASLPINKLVNKTFTPNIKYPFLRQGSRTRGKVSASARVNAKASASTAAASNSQSGSSSVNKGGSRTTSSGGWGGGAGAGWGSGQNAWGIGYGGGGGGSNYKIPAGMTGIPGMPSSYPGIPNGFPGMPAGGFPSNSKNPGSYSGAPATAPNKPAAALKGKKVSLKPNKGLDAKAAKAFQLQKGRRLRAKAPVKQAATKLNTYNRGNRAKAMFQSKSYQPGQLYRVQYYSSDPLQRPLIPQGQKIRQRIISDVMTS